VSRRYLVVIERSEDGYNAYSPDVPGCTAVGDTPAEAEERYRDALEFHFAALVADGLPIPEPKSRADYVTI
jgi:predicted RNase H-like HicB family nuclease